ncbi:hypothetical protein VTI74DRAFT_8742 [Chaetomium olivicolor]
MAQQPSFNSNNPFRRKAPAPAAAPPAVPPLDDAKLSSSTLDVALPDQPAGDRFWSQLQALPSTSQPPPATSFQKPKVVKKVRVQSPPSSPEFPEPPDRFAPAESSDSESSSSLDTDEQLDPFTSAPPGEWVDMSEKRDEPQTTATNRPPPNPFQKTLRDLEVGGSEVAQNSSTAPGTKGPLDVGAFGRLLMTGQTASVPAPYTRNPSFAAGDTASTIDPTSISRHSIPDALEVPQGRPQSSSEVLEEPEEDRCRLLSNSQSNLQPTPAIAKKKPPPPSSRHGKRISLGTGSEVKGEERSMPGRTASGSLPYSSLPSPSRRTSESLSDVNKPLPPAPRRSLAEEDAESVFDREAAGKVPEPDDMQPGLNSIMPPRPPTPPNASHAPSAPASNPQSKKPPPPPARRQAHGRSESKVNSSAASISHHDDVESSLRRSSCDSTRSRSSSMRVSLQAPAPPPPRRPSHPSRTPSSFTLSPTAGAISPGSTKIDAETIPGPVMTSPPPVSDTPSSSSSTPGTATPGTATPAGTTSSSATNPTPTLNHSHLHAKLSPPPPPPARNASVRGKRPPSVLSSSDAAAGLARRASINRSGGGKEGPPPPPPPMPRSRARGDSGASLEGGGSSPPASVPTSVPGLLHIARGVAHPGPGAGAGSGRTDEGQNLAAVAQNGSWDSSEAGVQAGAPPPASVAGDLLADLSALQREVDALRGRYEREGH